MSKNVSEAKQKKIENKKKQKQLDLAWEIVNVANTIKDPLEKFNSFKKFTANNLELKISCHNVTDFDKNTVNTLFELLKANMKSFYDKTSWGWNGKKKMEEMTDDRARYLIAKNKEGKIVAFSHFRFDLDFEVEVLYMYELQLIPEVRRYGLGKFMLQILELIAFSNNMRKLVLTVLKCNKIAVKFFEAMNYTLDKTCPEDAIFESYCYIILSKKNKRLL